MLILEGYGQKQFLSLVFGCQHILIFGARLFSTQWSAYYAYVLQGIIYYIVYTIFFILRTYVRIPPRQMTPRFLFTCNIRGKELCPYCSVSSMTLRGPPLDSEMRWIGQLWAKTNLLKWQTILIYVYFLFVIYEIMKFLLQLLRLLKVTSVTTENQKWTETA